MPNRIHQKEGQCNVVFDLNLLIHLLQLHHHQNYLAASSHCSVRDAAVLVNFWPPPSLVALCLFISLSLVLVVLSIKPIIETNGVVMMVSQKKRRATATETKIKLINLKKNNR